MFLKHLFLCLLLASPVLSQSACQQLSEGFLNPPNYAYPIVYHWWLGGHVDTIRLKEEIKSFSEAGVSGFTIFEIGSYDTVLVGTGPEFLGEASRRNIKFAVEEAGRDGREGGMQPPRSGHAGGASLTPQHAAQSIYRSAVTVDGATLVRLQSPAPAVPAEAPPGRERITEYGTDGNPVFRQEIAVL